MDQESFRGRKTHPTIDAIGAGKGDTEVSGWEFVQLRPSIVLVDHRYQRPLDMRHVRDLAKDFDPTLFGLGNVSYRSDKHYYALDAQHRCKAAEEAKFDGPLWFRVHRGLSLSEEADLFKKLNSKTKAVTPLAMFLAMVVAKDDVCCAILKIVHSYGLTIAGHRREGGIQSVKALVRAYKSTPTSWRKPSVSDDKLQQGHLLSRTLHILTSAWGKECTAFDGLLIDGVAGLLNKHGGLVDAKALSEQLARQGTPAKSIGQIRTWASSSGKTVSAASISWLENTYNRRKGRHVRLGQEA